MKTVTWKRKGNESDFNNLNVVLAALIERNGGQITIGLDELRRMNGEIGIRARYETNGDITLWTYNVVDDIKRIAGINE